MAPETLLFARDANGKPFLRGGGLVFNLSHSGGLALLAVSDAGSVGVDLEARDPALPILEIVRPRLSAPHRDALGRAAAREAGDAAWRYWVRFEAAMKCVGHGMGDAARIDALPADVFLHDIPAPPGFSACLATRSARASIAPIDGQGRW